MRKKIFTCNTAALFFFSFLTFSFAQVAPETGPGQGPLNESVPGSEMEEEEPPLEISSSGRYMPRTKADHQAGKVEVVETSEEVSYETKLFGKMPLEFSFEQEYIGLNNSTVVELPAHLVGLRTGIDATVPFFGIDKTYLRVGVSPSYYGDSWDLESSRFRIPSRFIGIHKPDDKWIFILGIGVYPDFEDVVVPILGFIYKPNDKWLFHMTPDDPYVSYAVNDKLTLLAEGGISYGEYEVDKDDQKNVTLRYRESHLGAGVKYRFNKHMEMKLSAGGVFGRSLEYDPDSLGKVVIKNSPYCEFRFDIKM